MSFTGIPLTALDFYEDLEVDNSKIFWAANKHIYDVSVKAPMAALALEMEPEFGHGKLFRPFRDVRFAKDKTPYKTHQGLWFDESALYVEVGAEGLAVAGGFWRTMPDQVARYRAAIDNDLHAGALDKILATLRKAKFEIHGEQLSRVPSGFAKDHERAELLKYKTLVARKMIGAPAWIDTPQAKTEISKSWRQITPLVQWLKQHVGNSDLPARG
ncbi:DUF2461 domain-containing protein [Nakamurella antarctica]|uniref:DUF2461 domain-containing protein n=1 Tax=Nakamurella antarctica TaxID=1902245 RepID=A0A3G8ZMQ1_9ACTN|nr:DUF2461 domain-containing protein [Nakamurella antarctica]AZI58622.1 DUF2461 domain-containing protein [Nakamurella antarctica]